MTPPETLPLATPLPQVNQSMVSQESADPFQELSFLVGVAENKNATYRAKMEDVHTYVANFAEKLDWGYFAIFDGHAGQQTARWCGNNLHNLLEQEVQRHEAEYLKHAASPQAATPADLYDMRQLLCDVFIKADKILVDEGTGSAGSTAVVAVLRWETEHPDTAHSRRKRMLYTSNVGDSRLVLCRGGKLHRLLYDHKALDPSEVRRIREAGGLIVRNRVNGVFAITRSLGDSYIKSLVTGHPFTTATEVLPEDEFLILACDGVWDVITDQKACDYVRRIFEAQRTANEPCDPSFAAKKLCNLAIENATTDNITVMVVLLDSSVILKAEAV